MRPIKPDVYSSKDATVSIAAEPDLYLKDTLPKIDENRDYLSTPLTWICLICLVAAKSQLPNVKDGYVNWKKGPKSSNKEHWSSIRVTTPCNDNFNLRLSKCSLKTLEYETFIESLGPRLKLTVNVFRTYLTSHLCSSICRLIQQEAPIL